MGMEWKKGLIALMLPCSIHAADWMVIPTQISGSVSMIDKDSIQSDKDGNKRVWMQQAHKDVVNDTQLGVSYNLVKNMFSVDCKSKSIGWLSGVYYMDEKVILSESLPQNVKINFEPIPPESIGEDIYKNLCKQGS